MKHSQVVVPLIALLMCLIDVRYARAQDPSRMEAGAVFSALRLGDFSGVHSGVGGRFSYDLGKWATAEAEANFFPAESAKWDGNVPGQPGYELVYERRRTMALFGVKTGWRGERVGIFAKARPGFARLSDKGVECGGEVCALILIARPVYRTEFAVDLGGVVEFYPTARTVARLDLSDLVIRQRSDAPPCRDCMTHNFSTGVGIGWRF
jgi:hypothetical protein